MKTNSCLSVNCFPLLSATAARCKRFTTDVTVEVFHSSVCLHYNGFRVFGQPAWVPWFCSPCIAGSAGAVVTRSAVLEMTVMFEKLNL